MVSMVSHEFSIMENHPRNKRYDSYEPDKYKFIKIDYEYIENLLMEFDGIPTYWHT